MPEPSSHHGVAGYMLGSLDESDRARFEAHLLDCEPCRVEIGELSGAAELVAMAAALPAEEAPEGLEQRAVAAIRAAAAAPVAGTEAGGPASSEVARAASAVPDPRSLAGVQRPDWRRLLAPRRIGLAAAAVAIAVAIFTGGQLLDGGGSTEPAGTLEVAGTLTAPSGSASAEVAVRQLGIGRVVTFASGELPILPTGEYYELWFVGPGDSAERPNRISAGTFHPDQDGNSNLELTAAVDPSMYPKIVVTAEPGNGDPLPNGPEVLLLNTLSSSGDVSSSG